MSYIFILISATWLEFFLTKNYIRIKKLNLCKKHLTNIVERL